MKIKKLEKYLEDLEIITEIQKRLYTDLEQIELRETIDYLESKLEQLYIKYGILKLPKK